MITINNTNAKTKKYALTNPITGKSNAAESKLLIHSGMPMLKNSIAMTGSYFNASMIDKNIETKKTLHGLICGVFQQDREVINDSFMGEIDDDNKYSKIGYVQSLLSKDTKNSTILNYMDSQNIHTLKANYDEFYYSTLQSLKSVSKGDKEYSTLFLEKKIGRTPVADIWLEYLTGEKTEINDEQKIELLNKKLKNNKDQDGLILHTIKKHFLNEIKNETAAVAIEKSDFEIPKESNLEKIKQALENMQESSADNKIEKFLSLLGNEDFLNQQLNKGKKLVDVLLQDFENDGIDLDELDMQTKKEALSELAEDKKSLNSIVDNTLSAVRQKIVKEKIIQKGKMSSLNQSDKEEIENFKKQESETFIRDICKSPSVMSTESLSRAFSLIGDSIESSDKDSYNKMFKNIDLLSNSVLKNDFEAVDSTWKDISQNVYHYWKESVLDKEIANKQKAYIKVNEFLKSDLAVRVDQTNAVSAIFNSDDLSVEEKAFLADKLNEGKSGYGYDLCVFLMSHPTNNGIRGQIVRNISQAEEFADENYDDVEELFIKEIEENDTESDFINKRINNKKFIDRVVELTPQGSRINLMTQQEKIDYLQSYPKEELESLTEKIRGEWIKDRSRNAYLDESSKYDINNRLDEVMDNLQIECDGKKVSVVTLVNEGLSELYNQNIDIQTMQTKTLAEVLSSKEALFNHDKNMNNQFLNQNKQLERMTEMLYSNGEESKKIQQMISLSLDKIEKLYPEKKQEVKDTRKFMQKLGAGIFNKNNLIPGSMLAFKAVPMLKAGLISGEPTTMAACGALLVAIYGAAVVSNVAKEFKPKKNKGI